MCLHRVLDKHSVEINDRMHWALPIVWNRWDWTREEMFLFNNSSTVCNEMRPFSIHCSLDVICFREVSSTGSVQVSYAPTQDPLFLVCFNGSVWTIEHPVVANPISSAGKTPGEYVLEDLVGSQVRWEQSVYSYPFISLQLARLSRLRRRSYMNSASTRETRSRHPTIKYDHVRGLEKRNILTSFSSDSIGHVEWVSPMRSENAVVLRIRRRRLRPRLRKQASTMIWKPIWHKQISTQMTWILSDWLKKEENRLRRSKNGSNYLSSCFVHLSFCLISNCCCEINDVKRVNRNPQNVFLFIEVLREKFCFYTQRNSF